MFVPHFPFTVVINPYSCVLIKNPNKSVIYVHMHIYRNIFLYLYVYTYRFLNRIRSLSRVNRQISISTGQCQWGLL